MKKILAMLLAVLMVVSMFTVSAAAAKEKEEWTKYPVILVPGYTSTAMYTIDENGEKVMFWGDLIGIIADHLGEGSSEILTDLQKTIKEKDMVYVAERLASGFNYAFEEMACNNDGTSSVPVYHYASTAEELNYANLRAKYPEGDYQPEAVIAGELAEVVGYENIYAFACDFRMGAIELSDKFRGYVDEVLAYHNEGKSEKDKVDKVNIYAVSHGGQVSGTYISRYGHEGKVNNAVLTVPALGGARIAYDLYNGTTQFNIVELITFLEHGMTWEEDYHYLVDTIDLAFGDDLIADFFPVALETIKYWGSLWDFMPLEYYEEMKAKFLDPVEDAKFIAKTDKMHYEVMSPDGKDYFEKGFKRAQETGTNVYILAGYDSPTFTGAQESADMLITAKASTGATVAPLGQRFNDGYVQKVDTGLYQVSPSMTVDLSTGYIPYHTWLIENYYHGMTLYDDYTMSLAKKLLLVDKKFDVTSFEEYPQFHATTNVSHGVTAYFTNDVEGYLTKNSSTITVKNLSKKNTITLMNVAANGLEISFEKKFVRLAPGAAAEIPFTGEIPDVKGKNFEITVSYLSGNIFILGERTLDFTLMGKEQIKYDEANPLVAADYVSKIDTVIDENTNKILVNVGLKDTASILFNIFYGFVETLSKTYSFINGIFNK